MIPKNQNVSVLSPELLLNAYSVGVFPMSEGTKGDIFWYSPDPRAILPLDSLKISRSLLQTIKKNIFEIRIDTSFESVIRFCAERDETWISEKIISAYVELFHLGYAHSVEAWNGGKLVGGLYGVSLGASFFGESMFSRMKDASKVALVALVERLNEKKFELLDTQYTTPHLEHFGVIEIRRPDYLKRLSAAIKKERTFV
ncbi:MAG: leucyl/phenylalanyl-tRNA--protein transferase [Ignavibacteriales bacterium]|nr:leucyl/phenylalanyl-tRNA--protein transferase [Ignavibacteriales bacterium]